MLIDHEDAKSVSDLIEVIKVYQDVHNYSDEYMIEVLTEISVKFGNTKAEELFKKYEHDKNKVIEVQAGVKSWRIYSMFHKFNDYASADVIQKSSYMNGILHNFFGPSKISLLNFANKEFSILGKRVSEEKFKEFNFSKYRK